ncbi:pyridoxamine 5'-phosphate oxidase [Neptunicoccus sediminis]|uniref:pyridoxamine 5'-phosphate oxidase n=1 Tax=Neptunicoccus sediminis TaxID=1892596 RepID=UPI000845D79A|nr:pyridoxamine 5'-phosphate oxidase [Neptunicoccus sediminis]
MKPTDLSSDRQGVFAGDDPFEIARNWLAEAGETEANDPNAVALATVDAAGLPNVRMVLLKEIQSDSFVFFTNYTSAKAAELDSTGKAAFVMHWKTLRRQIRVRGTVSTVSEAESDAYFQSRSVFSRIGAWASDQSSPLDNRQTLVNRAAELTKTLGENPERPPFWGGFRISPVEIEFWCDGADRLHDRFVWRKTEKEMEWTVSRLNP